MEHVVYIRYLLAIILYVFIARFLLRAWKQTREDAKQRALEEDKKREWAAWQDVYKLLPPDWCDRETLLKRLGIDKNSELRHRIEHMPPSGRLALEHVRSVVQESEDRIRSIRELARTLERAIRACKEFLSSPVRDRQHGIRQELPKIEEQLQYAAARIQTEHNAIQIFVVDTIADIINGHADVATDFVGNWAIIIARSVSKCEAVLPVAIPALQQALGYLRW